jgi:hypothetical protein
MVYREMCVHALEFTIEIILLLECVTDIYCSWYNLNSDCRLIRVIT